MVEKAKIKEVFDNVKHFLVCGAVLYAAIFTFKLEATTQFDKWQNISTGILLVIASLVLLLLNSHHALHVYFPKFKDEKNKIKRAGFALFFATYFSLSISLILSTASKINSLNITPQQTSCSRFGDQHGCQ